MSSVFDRSYDVIIIGSGLKVGGVKGLDGRGYERELCLRVIVRITSFDKEVLVEVCDGG